MGLFNRIFGTKLKAEKESLVNWIPFNSLDQIKTIKETVKSLPPNYELYVKEHPTQGPARGWRDISFYEEIIKMNITIIGSGYVGLVSGICLAKIGHNIVCVDKDENKIKQLQSNIIPIFEPGLEDLLKEAQKNNNITFTTDLQEPLEDCDVVFIAVGTPQDEDGSADLSYVLDAAKEISLKSDSLESLMLNRAVYLENINNILSGNELITPTESNSSAFEKEDKIIFEKSKADSLLRLLVEAEDKSSIYVKSVSNNNYLTFFTPLSGLISDTYNSKIKHFGVDLVAKDKSRISSVLDGTVLISHWTSETGYVIAIQHKNDYVSLYKHNSLLLKEAGDFVNAGDHIAVIGNSGELSSGPHLHFELWHKGTPVNPEDYISF